MKIAIVGTRGIPACYGGFETFAEELAVRLVERGHHVVVYGRSYLIKHPEPTYRGVELRLLPAPRQKYLETPIHSLLSLIHLLRHPVDVILVCNAANSPFLWITRLFSRSPVAVNVDGIERKRAKWSLVGRLWYRLGELCSVLFASRVVADAEVIRDYYREAYRCESTVIRYGHNRAFRAEVAHKVAGEEELIGPPAEAAKVFAELGIEPFRYILYVSRLEPENNAHVVIKAYNAVQARLGIPLLIVGGAPYAHEYIDGLHKLAGPGVIFAGFRFGADYEALQLRATAYVQATEVGGTHPALVEAMGFGNCVIANGTPENREVVGESGFVYAKNSVDELAAHLLSAVSDRSVLLDARKKALARAEERFEWSKIASDYERLFEELRGVSTPRNTDAERPVPRARSGERA